MASDADRWRTAICIVEQSGIADLLARWRAEDRGDKRPGPTPWLNETQVFTLFLILTLHRRLCERGLLEQSDLDRLMGKGRIQPREVRDTPKGIDAITLRQVLELLAGEPDTAFSTDTVALRLSLSRTTARRWSVKRSIPNGCASTWPCAKANHASLGRVR